MYGARSRALKLTLLNCLSHGKNFRSASCFTTPLTGSEWWWTCEDRKRRQIMMTTYQGRKITFGKSLLSEAVTDDTQLKALTEWAQRQPPASGNVFIRIMKEDNISSAAVFLTFFLGILCVCLSVWQCTFCLLMDYKYSSPFSSVFVLHTERPIEGSKRHRINLCCCIYLSYLEIQTTYSRFHWPLGLRCGSTAARQLRLWVRIPPGAWMSICCECCVLSGRGLCDGLITRPEKSCRLWCVVVCVMWKPQEWGSRGLRWVAAPKEIAYIVWVKVKVKFTL